MKEISIDFFNMLPTLPQWLDDSLIVENKEHLFYFTSLCCNALRSFKVCIMWLRGVLVKYLKYGTLSNNAIYYLTVSLCTPSIWSRRVWVWIPGRRIHWTHLHGKKVFGGSLPLLFSLFSCLPPETIKLKVFCHPKAKIVSSWLSRGSCTGLVTVGPTKVQGF